MLNVIHQFETSTVLFFVTVCFVAGFIKGIVGFAMPMIILGCSAALGMPLLGLAVLIMPTLVTNIYQVSLFGKAELVKSIRDFRFFLFTSISAKNLLYLLIKTPAINSFSKIIYNFLL